MMRLLSFLAVFFLVEVPYEFYWWWSGWVASERENGRREVRNGVWRVEYSEKWMKAVAPKVKT